MTERAGGGARRRLTPVLLLLWAAPAAAQERSAPLPAFDYTSVRTVLHRRGPQDAREPEQLVTSLAALGAPLVPELYELALGHGMDALIGEEWVPSEWLCEPEGIAPLAQQALLRAPRAALLAQLDTVLAGERPVAEMLVVLRMLGDPHSSAGLELVLRCATRLGDLELQRPSVRKALRESLTSLLRTDPHAWSDVDASLAALEPAVCRVLVEAIGAAERGEGMRVLTRLFGRAEPPAELVAESMAEIELARPWVFGGQTLETCKAWWRAPDPEVRARMARLAGRLGTADDVPALIEQLAESDKLVRRCAQQALEQLAGGGALPDDESGWDAWYEREKSWRDTRWSAQLDALTAAAPGPANLALRELTRHPLYRQELAPALAERLSELPRSVAVAACAELERGGSRRALPGLVATLEKAPPQLRSAAWHALRVLSGEQLELSVPLWRQLVDA